MDRHYYDNQEEFDDWFLGSKIATRDGRPLDIFLCGYNDWEIGRIHLHYPGLISVTNQKARAGLVKHFGKAVRYTFHASLHNPVNLEDPRIKAELITIFNLDPECENNGYFEEDLPSDVLLNREMVIDYLIANGYDGTVSAGCGEGIFEWSVFKVQQLGYERRFAADSPYARNAVAHFFICKPMENPFEYFLGPNAPPYMRSISPDEFARWHNKRARP